MIKVIKLCNIIPGDYSSASQKVAAEKTMHTNYRSIQYCSGSVLLDLLKHKQVTIGMLWDSVAPRPEERAFKEAPPGVYSQIKHHTDTTDSLFRRSSSTGSNRALN